MTINNDASSIDDNGVVWETTGTILQMVADNQAEEGGGGDSDVEGGKVGLHNDVVCSVNGRHDEHFMLINNNLDIDKLGRSLLHNWL